MSLYQKILERIQSVIIVDVDMKDVCESIEELIRENGYRLAFPVNVSINEVAAHSTASPKETRTITDKDLVKIDFGYISENGIIDSAVSVNLDGRHKELIDAVESAVNRAIHAMKPGVRIDDISGIIQDTIISKGFKPITNLTGHRISDNLVHDEPSIPPVRSGEDYVLREGDRFAVEVFATYPDGKGEVVESNRIEIFSIIDLNKSRVPRRSLRVYEYILMNYGFLPFARRWISKEFGESVTRSALGDLMFNQMIEAYPELVEGNGRPVAQYERTVIVEREGARVLE
ncbi:MAG: type II methionyl aminopeptidase [Candidatus Micrarchaeota archaeon]|nr:type II methionyl aminopeptidase [Candidatus Micrarchaeota archaeon]MCX8154511.1 type II methionyl aminopeptidase [Candidatus Micrarchaeota archaeon]